MCVVFAPKSVLNAIRRELCENLSKLIIADDLQSLCRRLLCIAYEDIGLANPGIGPKVVAACAAARELGNPEARLPLASIVIEMALSPKSNTAYMALDRALTDIRSGNTGNVPNHIKTNSHDYKYPHDYKNDYVKQEYLPDKLKGKKYYQKKRIYQKKIYFHI